jgi:hypothetical protein
MVPAAAVAAQEVWEVPLIAAPVDTADQGFKITLPALWFTIALVVVAVHTTAPVAQQA